MKHLFFAGIALNGLLAFCAKADTTIAANGKSTFTIVLPTNAPTSVQNAARELQQDIELATSAKLPLQKDGAKITGNFISLGSTEEAKTAGISSEKMTDESYRILTKNGNVYIIGPDTPDGGWTREGGTSEGTANGTYSFLEDYLDVRWLMPGKIGLDVPAKSTFTLTDIDRTFTPRFSMRQLTHLTNYANASQNGNILAWCSHLKVGERAGATNWYYMHSWWPQLNAGFGGKRNSEPDTPAVHKAYDEYPGWFAMDKNGKRPFPRNHYAKLETTNQGLVQWFAAQAVEEFKTNKRPVAFSLSPSDGGGWSLSPESVALYDTNPGTVPDPEDPQSNASMSSLVLKWYHDVAQIVKEKAPDRMLTGFLYSSYIYPPQKFSAKLPDNFSPVIAPSRNYGYGLYREDTQKYFHTVMDDWAKVVTGKWFYYDLPNQILRQDKATMGDNGFPGGVGLVTPPAADILNIIFPQLIKSHINGGDIYGDTAWSNAALSNYILAKMKWDPTLNAFDVRNEWLSRAYGPAAGKKMETFYDHLNGWFRDYYVKNKGMSYKLQPAALRDLFAAHYPEMENLFLQAKTQPITDAQKQRLQLIEDNLIVLQWRLRNAHYLPKNFASPLQRGDAQISDLIAAGNNFADLPMFPGITTESRNNRSRLKLPWKVLLSKDALPGKVTLPKWDDGQFLIYAAKDGDIHITTQMVANGAYFAAYEIKNQKGELVTSGIFNTEKPLIFTAKAGQAYMLNIPLRKPVNFQLQVQNAAVATGNLQGDTLYLSGKSAPLYVFYVPGQNPVGVIADDDGAKIRKPYSGAVVDHYIKSLTERGKYSEARLLQTFDEGWLFQPDPQNDGIKRGVLNADFNDNDWIPISPLDWWQTQGFADYHGPAWYRLKFQGKEIKKGEEARIYFGAIDGNATVYLNGKKVAEHQLGADFAGWDKAFTARANRYLKPDENILAVQVISKNDTTASGIFKPVALYAGVRN